jgi:hypothetical protein
VACMSVLSVKILLQNWQFLIGVNVTERRFSFVHC